jgi:predicted HicB family RNase H-like nuclease
MKTRGRPLKADTVRKRIERGERRIMALVPRNIHAEASAAAAHLEMPMNEFAKDAIITATLNARKKRGLK